jgi:hypothetical protein
VTEFDDDVSGLRALFINCTLNRSPKLMREHGWATDDWPAMFEKVLASDMARMFKAAGGVPAYGSIRSGWDVGCRYDFANAEHRAAIPST